MYESTLGGGLSSNAEFRLFFAVRGAALAMGNGDPRRAGTCQLPSTLDDLHDRSVFSL